MSDIRFVFLDVGVGLVRVKKAHFKHKTGARRGNQTDIGPL